MSLVFFLSAAILAYEVVLMRVFSMAQWHHFASMILSVALLGFGLSGTLLALWPVGLRRSAGWAAVAFMVTAPVGLWWAPRIPFSPMLLVWQPAEAGGLAAVYGVLTVPFVCGALAIGAALARAREQGRVGKVYAANLAGSALGAVLGWWAGWLPLPVPMNEFKALPKTLAMDGARLVETSFHPLGRVDVVACAALRVAPGLSLHYRGAVPPQPVIFVDGEGGSAQVGAIGDAEYLDWLPSALAYAAVPSPMNVLVVGVGGGGELVQAARSGAARVIGVELHPHVAALAGKAVEQARAEMVVGDARAFVRKSRERFDVIQVSVADSPATAAGGLGAAGEAYLYTVEAMREFWERLSERGVLCVTRWLRVPPRDEWRLFATAVEALESAGVSRAGEHVMFVRGWTTGTLLMRRAPFDEASREAVRRCAERLGFAVEFGCGGAAESLPDGEGVAGGYREALQRLAGGAAVREEFYRGYLFDVRPRTDDRPYFFHFFRWRSLPELRAWWGGQWLPMVEWGYVVVWATLAQAGAASVGLVGLPAWVMRRRGVWRGRQGWVVFGYFGALGMGFMVVELALMQRCHLFLGHPLYAAVVTIGTMLVAAGCGAWWSSRWGERAAWVAVAVAAVVAVYAWWGLDWVFARGMRSPDVVRFGMTVVLVALPALGMGMMFPAGLSRLAPVWLPWAWGVNGCFSVVGAALEMVVAMDVGLRGAMGLGAVLYVVAGVLFSRLPVRGEGCR